MLTLEVVTVPVVDVDRSLAFYRRQVGFTLDVDYRPTADFRIVQLTPPGSACSVQLVATVSPCRVRHLYLVTTDLAAEREKLIARGVAVGTVRHKDRIDGWAGDGARGCIPSVATTPALPISLTRTAIRGHYRSGATAPQLSHKSTTTSPPGCEQHIRRLPSAGFSRGAG